MIQKAALKCTMDAEDGWIVSHERACVGVGVQTLDYSNVRKTRRWEVDPLNPRRIWRVNWTHWENKERNFNKEGGSTQWCFLPKSWLTAWEERFKPVDTRWQLKTTEASAERRSGGGEQQLWMTAFIGFTQGSNWASQERGRLISKLEEWLWAPPRGLRYIEGALRLQAEGVWSQLEIAGSLRLSTTLSKSYCWFAGIDQLGLALCLYILSTKHKPRSGLFSFVCFLLW